MKKIIIAFLLSFMVMFGLAGLFSSLIVNEYISNNILPQMLKPQPNMIYIIAGYMLLSFLMVMLYPKLVNSEQSSVKSDFLFGAFISVLWLLPITLVLHGVYNFPTLSLLIDSSWALLEQGLGGMTIGFSYRYFLNKNTHNS